MAINIAPPTNCPPAALYFSGNERVEHILDVRDSPVPIGVATAALASHPGDELVLTIMRRYDQKTGASEGTEWLIGVHDPTKVKQGKDYRFGVPLQLDTYFSQDRFCGIETSPGATMLPTIDQQQNARLDALETQARAAAAYGPQLQQLNQTVQNYGARITALEQGSQASAKGLSGLTVKATGLELQVNALADEQRAHDTSISQLRRDVNGVTSKQTIFGSQQAKNTKDIGTLEDEMKVVENAIYPYTPQDARFGDRIHTNLVLINGVNGRVDTLGTTVDSQGKTIASQGKTIASQGETITKDQARIDELSATVEQQRRTNRNELWGLIAALVVAGGSIVYTAVRTRA